ncbi:RodZ domain-containing protein [Spiribacter insolitus]|uniref:RodZ domain-containing protein n=1 Tax=Spiribacter insolitus TaxID=3122417 RepID=A0ABV3T995_9GAMM
MTEQQRSGDSSNTVSQAAGPGRLVRDARLRRDMSTDQVAEALHLDRRTVEQLEADDFEALPPLTFVRGYLRAYCHLLDLDPEPVIGRLADAGITDNESPLKAHAGAEAGDARTPRPVSRGPGFLGLALGLALLIAGVVAAGWWLSRAEISIPFMGPADESTEPAPSDRASQNASSSDAAMTQAPSDGQSMGTAASKPTSESMDTDPEPAESVVAAPETETAPSMEETADSESAVDTSPTTAGVSSNEDAADSSVAVPDAPAATVDAPVAEPDELVFRFSGDSWMEVTDDRGERLLFGMAEPGEERLTGRAPFDIVIGNTSNVRLEYGDEEVDLEAYARGNVARFTLGGS